MKKSVSLKKLKIARFGCLPEGLEIEFAPQGIHIIAGPNESGKSTIMTAILGVLFGDIDTRDYFPWGASPEVNFSAHLELYCSDSTILRIHKDFKRFFTEVFLIDENGGKQVLFRDTVKLRGRKSSVQEYHAILEEKLGFSGSDFFTRVHFVRQEEMQVDLENAFLQQVGISEKADLTTVLNALQNRHKELTRYSEFFGHTATNDRKIELLEKEIRLLEERRTNALSQRDESASLRLKMKNLASDLTKKEKEIAELEHSIEMERQLFSLMEEHNRVREHLQRLTNQRKQLEELNAQIKTTEEKINSEFSVFKSASEQTIEALNEIMRLEHSLSEKYQTLEKAEEELNSHKGKIETLIEDLEQTKSRFPVDTESFKQIESLMKQYEAVKELDEKIIQQTNSLRAVSKKIIPVLLIGLVGLILIGGGVLLNILLALIPGIAVIGFCTLKGFKLFSEITAKKHLIANNEKEKDKINKELSTAKTALSPDVQNVLQDIMQGKLRLSELQEQLQKTAELTNKLQVEKGMLNKTQEGCAELKQEITKIENRLNNLKRDYGHFIINNDIPLTQSKYREYLELKSKRDTLLDRLNQEPSYDKIVQQEQELELDYRTIYASLQEFLQHHPPMKYLKEKIESNPAEAAQDLDNKREGIKTEKKELERLKEEQRELRTRLEVLAETGESESVDSLAGMIEDKRKELKQLQRRAEAIRLAALTLREALGNFEQKYAQEIIDTASRTFNIITNGRYQHLQRKDGKLFLITPEGEMVTPERISQGARDQLYLSVRLALAETLSSKIMLPVILDDPFVHCDAERLQAIKELFSHLASGWQILLFTCQPERFKDWGEFVLRFS
ncbi:AAA family ATPase [Candidatus Sumerlaeota bacterium]|nr:AAA family ATPase [Candidatus Sumerlaeota bacterium]